MNKQSITPQSILPFVLFLFTICVGCTSQTDHRKPQPQPDEMYHAQSWQTIIPTSCQMYFDGCNNCRRTPDNGIAACTKKACMTYQKPVCLDDSLQLQTTSHSSSTAAGKTVQYRCDDQSVYSVIYHQYVAGDQRVKLKDDQIMFRDHQSSTISLLERQPSSSGSWYNNDNIEFIIQGDDARIKFAQRQKLINCKVQPQNK